jgi:hypothetical protein
VHSTPLQRGQSISESVRGAGIGGRVRARAPRVNRARRPAENAALAQECGSAWAASRARNFAPQAAEIACGNGPR